MGRVKGSQRARAPTPSPPDPPAPDSGGARSWTLGGGDKWGPQCDLPERGPILSPPALFSRPPTHPPPVHFCTEIQTLRDEEPQKASNLPQNSAGTPKPPKFTPKISTWRAGGSQTPRGAEGGGVPVGNWVYWGGGQARWGWDPKTPQFHPRSGSAAPLFVCHPPPPGQGILGGCWGGPGLRVLPGGSWLEAALGGGS